MNSNEGSFLGLKKKEEDLTKKYKILKVWGKKCTEKKILAIVGRNILGPDGSAQFSKLLL